MTSAPHPDCTVIVNSCDKYVDLLDPFLALFRKYWPDCPFELVLFTESEPTLRGKERFDRVIACGKGLTWSQLFTRALAQIATPYVLFILDDYFLTKPVDTAQMLRRLEQIKAFDADNLRMIPNPKPTKRNADPFGHETDLFRYKPTMAYSIATQSGFWRREFLSELASKKPSIWEFERFGSFDPLAARKPLLVTPTQEFPSLDVVHKGHWEKYGVELLKANGIACDFSIRGLPPLKVRLIEGLKALIFAIFPATLIVRIQNLLNVGMKERPKSAQ